MGCDVQWNPAVMTIPTMAECFIFILLLDSGSDYPKQTASQTKTSTIQSEVMTNIPFSILLWP